MAEEETRLIEGAVAAPESVNAITIHAQSKAHPIFFIAITLFKIALSLLSDIMEAI